MKSRILAGLVFSALACGVRADEEKFSATLSPADLAAAGLAGITPAQLARLDELVERYKTGAPTAAPRAAEPKPEAAAVPPVRPGPAAGGSATASVPASVPPKPGARAGVVPIESSIAGSFRGWAPRQVFVLANGQRWQVANNESYYSPVIENPKVEIVPAAFSGYWMRFPGLDVQVRVKPLNDN
jgi:hypothetical protein